MNVLVISHAKALWACVDCGGLEPMTEQGYLLTTSRQSFQLDGLSPFRHYIEPFTTFTLNLHCSFPLGSFKHVTSSGGARQGRTESSDTEAVGEARDQQELRRLQTQQTSTMGELEPWSLCVHSVLGHSPWHGDAHLQGEVGGFGFLDG